MVPSKSYLGIPIQSPTFRLLEVATWIPVINPRMVSLKTSTKTAVIAPKLPKMVVLFIPKTTLTAIIVKIKIPIVFKVWEMALMATIR